MIQHVGIVVPAHNEQRHLPACLTSVAAAIDAVPDVAVHSVLVMDACTDGTESVARQFPWLTVVTIAARNVGLARARGVHEAMRSAGAVDASKLWLATTDADSVVPANWLSQQISLADSGWDVIVGTVEVTDWSEHPSHVRHRWMEDYGDVDGHAHVHGANFGCRGDAYLDAGGWPPIRLGEDVALLAALSNKRILRTALLPVRTSARADPRAAGGFGDTLRALAG